MNKFDVGEETEPEVLRVDPSIERDQMAALAQRRSGRDAEVVQAALAAVGAAADGTENLLYPMKEALVAGASIGEITDALLPSFGRYRPSS